MLEFYVLCRILLSGFKHQRFSFLICVIIIINCCCCCSSLLISIFDFFRSWIPPLMLPLFLHKLMVLPLHKLMVLHKLEFLLLLFIEISSIILSTNLGSI